KGTGSHQPGRPLPARGARPHVPPQAPRNPSPQLNPPRTQCSCRHARDVPECTLQQGAPDMAQARTLSRRGALSAMAGAAAVAAGAGAGAAAAATPDTGRLQGRLKQSVCKWCYAKIPLPDLAAAAAAMGLKGIDLLNV